MEFKMNSWKNLLFSGIAILKNLDTMHAKMAEAAVSRVLEQQRNALDAVTRATTTIKSLF